MKIHPAILAAAGSSAAAATHSEFFYDASLVLAGLLILIVAGWAVGVWIKAGLRAEELREALRKEHDRARPEEQTMNCDAYAFDISRATDAGTLHAYAAEVRDNDTLTSDEKEDLLKQIGERFGALNAASAGKQKPRW